MEQKRRIEEDELDMISLMDLLQVCLKKWHWFVFSVFACVGIAVAYLLVKQPVYTVNADILIKEESKGGSLLGGMESSFSDLGLLSGNANVNNEMQLFNSSDLMRDVVSRLNLDFDYQEQGIFRKRTLYGDSLPVKVTVDGLTEEQAASFVLKVQSDSTVSLADFECDAESFDVEDIVGMLNDTLVSPIGKIVVKPTRFYPLKPSAEIYVSRTPVRETIESYSRRLAVNQSDKKSSVINISLTDVSPKRGEDVLGTLIAVYNENWLKDKNRMAVSISMFINDRLGVIENELGDVDDDISEYQSKHLLPDVKEAAKLYMFQASETDAAIKALNDQMFMAQYIRHYLANEANEFEVLPGNFGIENANLAAQISEYNRLLTDRNGLVFHSNVKNPLVVEMDAQLASARSALVASIDNQIVALNAQLASQQGFSNEVRSQIASTPKQAKYLLSVGRQQKVKEALYLYLLQKREENELSQTFSANNIRIVKRPESGRLPTSPVKMTVLLIALVLGVLIPLGIVFMLESVNTKIRGRKDLEGMTIPFIGEIPQALQGKKNKFTRKQKEKNAIVVKKGNRDVVNEAFRVLRTNLEFMTENGGKQNVFVVTSFNPRSGKSFLTMNVAVCLAIKDKKVLVIDGDLRHGSSSAYVKSPKKGLSDYLNGRIDNIEDILVVNPQHPSLHVLPIGTVPPNPTELLVNERMKQIIDEVRGQYDYVFIDCPPIEIVADTQILEKLADRTIFVVRAGVLERSMLSELQNIYDEKQYKNMSLILNGTEGGGRYGYGYRYSYYGSDKK